MLDCPLLYHLLETMKYRCLYSGIFVWCLSIMNLKFSRPGQKSIFAAIRFELWFGVPIPKQQSTNQRINAIRLPIWSGKLLRIPTAQICTEIKYRSRPSSSFDNKLTFDIYLRKKKNSTRPAGRNQSEWIVLSRLRGLFVDAPFSITLE